MTLDILAFTLAAVYLIVVFAMLTIGLTGFYKQPVAARCHRCSRWMFNPHDSVPTCWHCRLHAPARPRQHSDLAHR